MSKLNEKIKTEEPILTFNIVNIIFIKELVTSNEGSLDGKMVRCKFIYKRRRKPRDRFKILMPKVRMLTLREFRHVFLHAEPQFDSETSDVCSKMAGREKGEYSKTTRFTRERQTKVHTCCDWLLWYHVRHINRDRKSVV